MNQKILITGGSGFIGANLIDYFGSAGRYDLMNLDIARPASDHQLKYWRKTDVLNRDDLGAALRSFAPDIVIHLAARTDLKGASLPEYAVNTEGTANLIEVCKQLPSVNHVLFASSMLVCRIGHVPSKDTEYSATTAYGRSKVQLEKIVRSTSMPWSWTIVRPTSIWGPGFKQPYRDFFEVVRRGRFLDLGRHYGTKTYGYIGNTVYQIDRIIHDKRTHGKTYYLGDQPPIVISGWSREIAAQFGVRRGRKVPFALVKAASWLGDLLNASGASFPMTSFRLKNMTTDNIIDLRELYELAPNPPYGLHEGVRKTVEWLKTSNGKG